MGTSRWILVVLLVIGMLTISTAPGGAQVADHLKCYKIKDPVKLTGLIDLDSEQFGFDPDCKIRKAKYFCGACQRE